MSTLSVYGIIFTLGLATPIAGLRLLIRRRTGEPGCFLDGILGVLFVFVVFFLFVGFMG